MCVVLDTNAFGPFFDENNKERGEFEPVFQWVVRGKGKLVYGGRTYKDEMRAASRYIPMFADLERAGKIVILKDENVNELQSKIRNIEPSDRFDDPHLVAIVLESKCRIVCTRDTRAIPYLKDSRFYTDGIKKPKLYISRRNTPLLQDKYIAQICKPSSKLPKNTADKLIGA
uniref:PIN domain-containing protein n=1 Tax=Candidatus Kentrum sp. FM TaxID=2126340 RepID=A0A450WF22_9GAMM|nr:MAG: hypothetical protein BECKFM1743A_GA0114220_103382 [Candidatus Kentron sp. FM]VFJ65400.1 MAG: hypothetical protein BECKFM1743C_GA0114222_103942 [Candidatus Kentron sp. FM]VFK15676.1 MAG: hypothetical protein BECKFM1743B_GA0114221_103832 [Candidatus Kentron sp. FM]